MRLVRACYGRGTRRYYVVAGRLHGGLDTRENVGVLPRVFQSRRVRIGLLIFGIATFYGLMEALYDFIKFRLYISMAASPGTQIKALPISKFFYSEFLFAYLWAIASPAILWITRKFRLARPHVFRNLL